MGYDLQSSIHKLGYCIQGNNVNWCLLKLIFSPSFNKYVGSTSKYLKGKILERSHFIHFQIFRNM